jgi:hypothetical protein
MSNQRKPANQVDDMILWGASPNQDPLSFINENQCSLELRSRLRQPYSGLIVICENEPKKKQQSELECDQNMLMKTNTNLSASNSLSTHDIHVIKEGVSKEYPNILSIQNQKEKSNDLITSSYDDLPFIIYVGNSPSTVHVLKTVNVKPLAPQQERMSNSNTIIILLFFLVICLIGVMLGLFFLLKSQGLLS